MDILNHLLGGLAPGDVFHGATAGGLGQVHRVAALRLPAVQALQWQVDALNNGWVSPGSVTLDALT